MAETQSFHLLDKRVQNWIWKQGWTSLLEIQENTIPHVIKGNCDIIVSAPTGGGKTEAVFLPIISKLLQTPFPSGYSILYLSPLKALINDQFRRLTDICGDLGIPVTPWHGDVSNTMKNSSFQQPRGILIITPESLESVLMHRNDRLKAAFSSLQYIVIDEIHSFGKKAGISIKPGTAVEELIPYLDKVDMILVMTVEPGFGGQPFIEASYERIKAVRAMLTERGLETDVQVDGGITKEGFWAGSRDDDFATIVGVGDVLEGALFVFVFDFDVGEGSLVLRAEVDELFASVD